MHRHGLSYRAARELLSMPQDVIDYGRVLHGIAAQRAKEMGS